MKASNDGDGEAEAGTPIPGVTGSHLLEELEADEATNTLYGDLHPGLHEQCFQ